MKNLEGSMRLLRAKVGGHFILQNSGWFTIHPGCTSIAAPDGSGKSTLLKALRSVNPPACDSDPAPFAEFPRFVTTAGYRRKILPPKKTAVIAVFVCDDPLREKLAAVDPVYWQTDRIEVGRRLDNFRWITFIEIAASSRWSELYQELVRLGQVFGEGLAKAEISVFLQGNASLQPADRVKGELADGLNDLLDLLAGYASSDQQEHQLQKVRRLANRAVHYQEAVRMVEESLPVFLILDRNNLLTGVMDVGKTVENEDRQQGGRRHCPDLFLLELLGIAQLFSDQAGEKRIMDQLRSQIPRLQESCRQLGERLRPYLPDCSFKMMLSSQEGRLEVQASIGGGAFISLAALSMPLRWMLSCAVCDSYYSEAEKKEIIFLLDEPDADLSPEEKSVLAPFLLRLGGTHQLLVSSASASAFPSGSGKRYQLRKDESGSTVVELKENNRRQKMSCPRE
jgi:hypothetical protein